MKKALLLGAALVAATGAMAQLAPGEYYIKSVNTGMFLNEGFSWGTLAVTKAYPCAFEVTAEGDGYIFKSRYGFFKPENGEYFMDGGNPVAVYLEKAGDYYLMKCGDKYMSINEEVDAGWLESMNMCDTYLFSVNQADAPKEDNKSAWQIISRAEMEAALAAATPENPVEASFYLKAGQIEVNADNNISSWPYVMNNAPADIVLPDGGWFGHDQWFNKTTYAWCINEEEQGIKEDCIDVVSQEVEGMPAGFYTVKYRAVNQGNDGATPLVIKFNDTEAAATNWEGTDLWYESAQNTLAHNVESASFEVKEDGKLSIRMEKTCKVGQQNRFAFKSFALSYLGAAGAGVADVATDSNAPVEYFNLQGVRVANPESGIFVRRQGSKVSKVAF